MSTHTKSKPVRSPAQSQAELVAQIRRYIDLASGTVWVATDVLNRQGSDLDAPTASVLHVAAWQPLVDAREALDVLEASILGVENTQEAAS